MKLTAQSEVGKIKRLLLKHVKDAFRSQDYIDKHWQGLNYLDRPDFKKAIQEYDALIKIFESHNIALKFLSESAGTGLDSIYVRDASIVTDHGMIICNMGKGQRLGEPNDQLLHYLSSGDKVLGSYQAPATIEGGDVAWLADGLLAVAEGYRTNAAGIEILRSLTAESIDELIVMDSPHYKGPGDVFHLMSVISPVDKEVALVYSPLMTVPFRNRLLEMGYSLIEVPEEEFDSLGSNVLALSPGVCLMVEGNPITRSRLEKSGLEVIEFSGKEICLKGSGGPTCLTRPLIREI